MFRWMTDIGMAAGRVPVHATRFTVEDDEAPNKGGGKTGVLDENEDEEDPNKDPERGKIVGDEDEEDIDPDDDQPRGKRDKQIKAYDDLKSENDRLKNRTAKQDQLLEELEGRLQSLEGGREDRQRTNERANTRRQLAAEKARTLVRKFQSLDKTKPTEYSEGVYAELIDTLLEQVDQRAGEISERQARSVYDTSKTREERREAAQDEALELLEEAGLGEEQLPLVEFMAGQKSQSWFRRTPEQEQIPTLVDEAVRMLQFRKRGSQEDKDEKRRHRRGMEGVIDTSGSTRSQRLRSRDDDEEDSRSGRDREEGPGSMLLDMKRLRTTQRRNTDIMLSRDRDR